MNKISFKRYIMKNYLTAAIALMFIFAACSKENVPVTDLTLNQAVTTRAAGTTFTLKAVVLPENATNKAVNWLSSDTDVATVANGVVSVLTAGATVTITATTEDGSKTADCVLTVARNCNTDTPGWGASLGTVSFASTQTWTITSGTITQIWSDAVQATGANKTTFDGGTSSNNKADARSNPDYKGDLFSYVAVIRFQDELCPSPWRVPTQQDFIDLDIALDGTGSSQTNATHRDKYLNSWGGLYGGNSNVIGTLGSQGLVALYWSQSESSATGGYGLDFRSNDFVNPQYGFRKDYGLSLRCVR